jgi:hypothetical protein
LACDISTNRAPRDILDNGVDEVCRESFDDENGSGGLIGGFVGVTDIVAVVVDDGAAADEVSLAGSTTGASSLTCD